MKSYISRKLPAATRTIFPMVRRRSSAVCMVACACNAVIERLSEPEEAGRILRQDGAPHRGIRRPARQQVENAAVVRLAEGQHCAERPRRLVLARVRMRPVRGPEDAL